MKDLKVLIKDRISWNKDGKRIYGVSLHLICMHTYSVSSSLQSQPQILNKDDIGFGFIHSHTPNLKIEDDMKQELISSNG